MEQLYDEAIRMKIRHGCKNRSEHRLCGGDEMAVMKGPNVGVLGVVNVDDHNYNVCMTIMFGY
ncbi:hypothetical protein A0H81_07551 [Grifola frondosa]|uniref:Uncharacterized protein n=1 Tax=Grifola frondosa TaxID=5627 RepID=A0A1C7M6P6_GRIFR|nr:hypothetical protein A0H81_07551 [Grifola frondosa]